VVLTAQGQGCSVVQGLVAESVKQLRAAGGLGRACFSMGVRQVVGEAAGSSMQLSLLKVAGTHMATSPQQKKKNCGQSYAASAPGDLQLG